METVEIKAFGKRYLINNPGAGRVGSKLAHGEPYEKRLLVEIYQQSYRGTAFDIGAHIGNHSLWLAAICGLKVYAWEPHDGSRDQLTANLALNPDLDITVYPWAAGDVDAVGRFTKGMWLEFDPDREGAHLKLNRGDVQVHVIDQQMNIPDLSVVKIDVEGMEPHVLRGMIRHLTDYKPVVYAETHTDEMREEISSILTPLGYTNTKDIQMGSLMTKWEVG